MRVTQVLTCFDPEGTYGGPTSVALTQAQSLIERGHAVRVVAGWAREGEPPTHYGSVPLLLAPVSRVLRGPRFSSLYSAAMRRLIKATVPDSDVVHLHLARELVPLMAGRCAINAEVPYVTQTHGMIVPRTELPYRAVDVAFTRYVLFHARIRYSLTADEDADIDAMLGQLHTTKRLRNGIALAPDDFPQVTADPEVLFLARLSPRKRVMDFAAMAADLSQQFPDVRFTIAGPDEGDLRQLKRFLESQPGDQVGYEGPVASDKVLERLARARVFVLPSVDEPFPVTVLQALSVGVPTVITTRNGLAPELSAADAAVVVEPTVPALSAAVARLLSDDATRDELGRRGRTYAVEQFSAQRVVDELVEGYESVLS